MTDNLKHTGVTSDFTKVDKNTQKAPGPVKPANHTEREICLFGCIPSEIDQAFIKLCSLHISWLREVTLAFLFSAKTKRTATFITDVMVIRMSSH